MENKTSKQKSRKSGSNGFYIVLSLCLIAVGVAAWSAVSAFSDFKTQSENSQPETPENSYGNITPNIEEPAQNELPEVEYEAPTEPEPTPAPTVPTAEYFIMPIEGNIIKTFDSVTLQYSATLGDMRLHEGIDIEAAAATAVRAAGDGTVTEIYEDTAYGYTVVIDHGNGIVAKYCGLDSSIPVSSGDAVSAGTEIGLIGSIPIESADSAHLHFEMYKDGKAVSPLGTMNME